MNIYTNLDVNDSSWLSAIQQNPNANIFHTPYWANLLYRCYNIPSYVLAILDNHQLLAGVPFSIVKHRITKPKIVSLPFTDYCNPIISPKADLEKVASSIIEYATSQNIQSIEMRWDYLCNPAFNSGHSYVYHYIRLDGNLENAYKNISRTQKQNIHIAEKNNIDLHWGQDIDSMKKFYQLQCLTRKRQGIPVQPWKFFEGIVLELLRNNLGFVILAYKNNNCLAGGVFLHWNSTITYKYAASSLDDQNLRPNHLIIWKVLEWACSNGIRTFDFGRCDIHNTGLRTFKNRWGAVEQPLIYSVIGKKNLRDNQNLLHSILSTMIRKSPVLLARLLGELFYQYLA